MADVSDYLIISTNYEYGRCIGTALTLLEIKCSEDRWSYVQWICEVLRRCYSTYYTDIIYHDTFSHIRSVKFQISKKWFHDNSSMDNFGHFVYRHFVYYCIPACRTAIHPTSVSANHYFHQFQLLFTLWFLFINSASTNTMIIRHIQLSSIVAWESRLHFQLKILYFHQSHF